ncbi:Gfo/Idh/MocA family oxidoreductase [Alteromonadaceae bacterium BrNp21-10]|nr:Gfo/Idh/MocA family oxidoreductase [Alteromonadaceae bacterium BrNp21-10]
MKTDNKIIRIGVIGLGNIAKQHIANIVSHDVQGCQITALCSRNETPLAKELGAQHFSEYQALIDSGLVDAVIIATPTMSHFDIAQYALQRNIHVMLEKPMGLSSFEGEALLQYANKDTVFGLMLNQRTDPTFSKMKQIVDSGLLGPIQRTHWTMTNWFRPEIYFQVSDWRATWKGEGGGMLVNQCIHNLDVFQWICGMPETIHGFCEFGKYHQIEVEDEVTAYLRYANGATGLFVGSTGESPGVNRFDIVGDNGSLHFDSGRLTQRLNQQSTTEFNQQTDNMFGMPESTDEVLVIEEKVIQHAVIMNNFVEAINIGVDLIAPAAQGLASLDMANAMLLSTWQNQPVTLPLDRQAYQQALNNKIAHSSLRQKSDKQAKVDMADSYR